MLEYAAMEIPTIAPRLKAITHYFDENSALFYEPDNAKDMAKCISDVYQDREIICNIKEKLKLFNQKYNWPAYMRYKYLRKATALPVNRYMAIRASKIDRISN